MKNVMWFLIAAVLVGGMAGCAGPTPVPTPDTRGAIEAVGSVTARSGQPPVDIRLGPSPNYGVVGQIEPGDSAQLVGVNLVEDWLLVKYGDRSGWVQAASVDYTIAR